MEQRKGNEKNGRNDRAAKALLGIYLLCLAFSIVLIGRLFYLQFIFTPDPLLERYLTPKSKKETLEPVRGSILAHDGRLLASSAPMYQIYMDCTVMKEAYATDKNRLTCWSLPQTCAGASCTRSREG